MSTFDLQNWLMLNNRNPITLSTASQESIGTQLANHASAIPATETWQLANLALFIPFILPAPMTVTKLFVRNGIAVSGNVDMGIYTPDGARVVSKGSTAQAGTSATQTFDITDTRIGAGPYYWGIAFDNVTASTFAWTLTGGPETVGLLTMSSAFPLPATATFATGSYKIPIVGMTSGSTL